MSCSGWEQTHTTITQMTTLMVVKWLEVHSVESVTSVARKGTEPTNVLKRELEEARTTEAAEEAEAIPEVEVAVVAPSLSSMEPATIVGSGAI